MRIRIFFLLAVIVCSQLSTAQTYTNTAPNGKTWYKINTRGKFLIKVRASGDYAVHEAIIFMVSANYNTAEYTIVSEYNYNHKQIKLVWGYVGDEHDRYLALKTEPTPNAAYANGYTISDVSNPAQNFTLELISDPNTVTEISPHNRIYVAEHSAKVGIGTTTPTEKLEVNGTIRSKEVKVEATGWPDYVFSPDYDLKSLEETETFIKENKHLPGIPSAEEVSENGIALGEMNARLLEKVEELTIHLIEKNAEIKSMKNEVQLLSQQIKLLNEKVELLTNK